MAETKTDNPLAIALAARGVGPEDVMIRVVILLQPGEAKALRAMCSRFALRTPRISAWRPQHRPDALNKLRAALDAAGRSLRGL